MSDPRDVFICRVVQGKSFVDVGGLWGTVAEKVSVAHRAGAKRTAMYDVTPEGEELWHEFHNRLKQQGVPQCDCFVGDVTQYVGPRYDVVHCAGVLYHHPNPMAIVTGLRRMTAEYLVLTSCVTQTRIENEEGLFEIPASGVVFVPALSDQERRVLAAYWRKFGVVNGGITQPCRFYITELNANDFGPWWFLPTPHAMQAMARVCGFEVIDTTPMWNDNAFTILCKVSPNGISVP